MQPETLKTGYGTARRKRDTEFARHAVNAYPRLVEALRDVLKDADFDASKPRAGKQHNFKISGYAIGNLRALLRELGEDA